MHTLISSALALSTVASSTVQTQSHPPLAFTRNIYQFSSRKRDVAHSLLLLHPIPTQDYEEVTTRRTTKDELSISSASDSIILTHSYLQNTDKNISIDSQKEFEMNFGRAVDILKQDYPTILTQDPSWSIYHQELNYRSNGLCLHGLGNYKRAFRLIHTILAWFYCEKKSGLTFRVRYDLARKVIRVSWNAVLVRNPLYGNSMERYVDGISEYFLDQKSGLITEHKLENLLINDQAVRPTNGVFAALIKASPDPEGVPVYFGSETKSWDDLTWEDMKKVKFQTWNPLVNFMKGQRSMSLFSVNGSSGGEDCYDRDAFQRKNQSREKFGLPHLTPEEFIKIEEQICKMDGINKKRAAFIAEEAMQARKDSKRNENFFGSLLKDECVSNFDCERPEVCCDLVFKKMCCSKGLGIVDGIPVERYQTALLRVPLPNDNIDY